LGKIGRIPLHPFLFGAYAIVALLANNISQVVMNIAFRSLIVVLLTILLILVLLKLLVKDWYKAAFIESILVIFFFSYGHLYIALEDLTIFGLVIGRHRFFILTWMVIFLFGSWWVIRSDTNAINSTRILNLVAIVALVFPTFQLINYRVQALRSFQKEADDPYIEPIHQTSVDLQVPEGGIPPDIYYIILDMYVRDDVLMEFFNYDNSPFLNSLIEKGFFVARCSQSNYPGTPLSIASSLNLNYLEAFAQELIDEEMNQYQIAPLVEGSFVRRELSNLGYKIVNVESGFYLTEWKDADVYLQTQEENIIKNLVFGGLNEFESMLLYSTAGMMLNEAKTLRSQVLIPLFDHPYIERRNQIQYALDVLGTIATSPGPKFVFVHIVAPHPPFVFGPNGEFFPRTTPLTLNQDMEDWDWDRYVEGYIGQVTFLNNQVLSAVQKILTKSLTSPIIIIQSDHGINRLPGDREHVAILNTYHLPGVGEPKIYHSISPVNSFRLIFRTYFGGDYDLLEDISYMRKKGEGLYDFRVVPNTRKDCDEW
jgi:hypothetical protein